MGPIGSRGWHRRAIVDLSHGRAGASITLFHCNLPMFGERNSDTFMAVLRLYAAEHSGVGHACFKHRMDHDPRHLADNHRYYRSRPILQIIVSVTHK